jgi:hypothetical protein
MPCEEYKAALMEAAAAGAEADRNLRAHLKTCAACQAALAEEQSLFAEIDMGLRVAANAEVPPSLLPRVRAALEGAAPKPFWSPKWYVLAGAGAMLAVLFVVQALQRPQIEPKPMESASAGAPVQSRVRPAQDPLPTIADSTNERAAAQRQPSGSEPREAIVNRGSPPEILVPSDQEVLLARYADEWNRRRTAPLVVASESNDIGLAPLEMAPIQIAELDVKLLAETQSQ